MGFNSLFKGLSSHKIYANVTENITTVGNAFRQLVIVEKRAK